MRIIATLGLLAILSSCQETKTTKPEPATITVVKPVVSNVPVRKDFVGQVYGIKDIQIRARVEGYLDKISFKEGEGVKKGAPLYEIDPQPFLAAVAREKSALAEAKIKLTKAKSDLDRIEPLAKINAVSKSDLDAANAEFLASKASVEAAEAQLELANIQLGYCNITAPITGLIGKTKARVGEFVGRDPNPVILNTVSKIDSFRVEFFLTETDYLRLARKIQEERASGNATEPAKAVPQELILSDGSIFEHKGYVDFVDREIDPTTGSILVQATFPNPDRIIRPGQFAKIRSLVSNIDQALLVPQRSVSQFQGTFSVYVVDENNTVHQRLITVGPKHKEYWVVLSGLEKNESIVLDAIQKVREGMLINPQLKTPESEEEITIETSENQASEAKDTLNLEAQ